MLNRVNNTINGSMSDNALSSSFKINHGNFFCKIFFTITDATSISVGFIVYVAIRASTLAARIFHLMSLVKKLEQFGIYFYAVRIAHPATNIFDRWRLLQWRLPGSLLTHSRNLPSLEVFNSSKIAINHLQNTNIDLKQFNETIPLDFGICVGMSLIFIKNCFDSNTDKTQWTSDFLIKNAKIFEKGGNHESVVLQHLYERIMLEYPRLRDEQECELRKKCIKTNIDKIKIAKQQLHEKNNEKKEMIGKEIIDLEDQIGVLESDLVVLEKEVASSGELIISLEKWIKESPPEDKKITNLIKKFNQKGVNSVINEFSHIEGLWRMYEKPPSIYPYILMDLSSIISLEVTNFEENVSLNSLKEKEMGIYQLSTCDHSMGFIKAKEGYYLFDPNFGLFACDKQDPIKTMEQILKKYIKGNKIEFTLHHF